MGPIGLELLTSRAAMLLYRLLAPQWEIYDTKRHGKPNWTAYSRPLGLGKVGLKRLEIASTQGWNLEDLECYSNDYFSF